MLNTANWTHYRGLRSPSRGARMLVITRLVLARRPCNKTFLRLGENVRHPAGALNGT